jgi:hypothetical protein
MRVQVEGHYGPTPASWPRSSLATSSLATSSHATSSHPTSSLATSSHPTGSLATSSLATSSHATSSHQTVVAEDQPTTRLLHQNQWTHPNPSIQDQTELHQKASMWKT